MYSVFDAKIVRDLSTTLIVCNVKTDLPTCIEGYYVTVNRLRIALSNVVNITKKKDTLLVNVNILTTRLLQSTGLVYHYCGLRMVQYIECY